MTRRRHSRPLGFTLIELLVVLGIILLLLGILIPTVSKVRTRAQETAVRAQITSLDAAILQYQQDFSAYPGPLPRYALYPTNTGTLAAAEQVFDKAGGGAMANISGAENLVLALLGGLAPRTAGGFEFDKNLIGRGPRGLNPLNPKSYKAYVEGLALSDGLYKDDAGAAVDSAIPEILDRFGSPMPILYLRAQVGARGVVSLEGKDNNADVFTPPAPTQYDIREILGYTISTGNQSIGEGKSIRRDDYVNPANTGGELPHGLKTASSTKTMDKSAGANYSYPYDAFPYFNNRSIPPTDTTKPNQTGTPRKRDGYILISAGVDRVYGTNDDITNFGSVLE